MRSKLSDSAAPLIRSLILFELSDLRYLLIPISCGLSVTLGLLMIYRALHGAAGAEIVVTANSLALGIAVLLIGLGRYLEQYGAEWLAQRVVQRLRLAIFNKVLSTTASDQPLHKRSSTFLRLTGDMTAVRGWIIYGIVNGTILLTLLLSSLTLLLLVHLYLAVTAGLSLGLFCVISVLAGRRLFIANQIQRNKRTRLLDRLSAQLESLPTILLFNQSLKEGRRFQARSTALAEATLDKAHWSGLLRAFSEIMIWGTLFALAVIGSGLVNSGQISAPQLVIILTSAVFLLHRLRTMHRVVESWASFKISFLRIETLLARPERAFGDKRPRQSAEMPILEFRQRNRTEEAVRLAVSDQELWLCPADAPWLDYLIALATGGRTANYRVRIAGVSVRQLNWQSISRSLAIASLRLPLLQGTVRRNLTYGRRKLSESQIDSILEQCAHWPVAESVVAKIDQNVNELSDLERVVATIIRAVLRRPSCVLVDLQAITDPVSAKALAELVVAMFDGAILLFPSHQTEAELHNLAQISGRLLRKAS